MSYRVPRATALPIAVLIAGLAGCGGSATTNVTGPTATRCQASVSNSTTQVESSGGTGSVAVTVGRECSWTASSQAPWIAITDGAQGQGSGTVRYRVSANAEAAPRIGALLVADREVDLSQKAAPCQVGVTAPTTAVGADGGQMPVAVQANGPCPWTASASAEWVALAPQAGSGTAQIFATLSPNDGPERTATISVATASVLLRQLSGSSKPPAPSPEPEPTPTPDPTPPPPLESIHLSGEVGDVTGTCPTVRFELQQHIVETTERTEIRGGGCSAIQRGVRLSVDGEVRIDGIVNALRITIDKHK